MRSPLLCSGVAAVGQQRALEARLWRRSDLRTGPDCGSLHRVRACWLTLRCTCNNGPVEMQHRPSSRGDEHRLRVELGETQPRGRRERLPAQPAVAAATRQQASYHLRPARCDTTTSTQQQRYRPDQTVFAHQLVRHHHARLPPTAGSNPPPWSLLLRRRLGSTLQ